MKNMKTAGLPLRKFNYSMAVLTVILFALLLYTTRETRNSYYEMRETTEQYVLARQSAYDLQIGSDNLTDQVRCYAETGDLEYLEGYFEEANVTRHRDHALAVLRESAENSEAYRSLELAMAESVDLMTREYYAMRLTAEAKGHSLSKLPEEVADFPLTEEDLALSPEAQQKKARALVFDKVYEAKKAAISGRMQECLDDLSRDLELKQMQSADRMRNELTRQRIMLILLLIAVLVVVVLNSALVITPLMTAVLRIRAEQPMPVTGASEFRFLARTYNTMYNLNQESKKRLEYAALHDKLTALYNRAGYDMIMSGIDPAQCALMILDIDDFKGVNDSFGHKVGDRVLANVASVIKGAFRSDDAVCRLGGDEFAVVLHINGREFESALEQKVIAINKSLREPPNSLPPVSLSAGVAFGEAADSQDTLYIHADKALYQVKQNGRNGCAFYTA